MTSARLGRWLVMMLAAMGAAGAHAGSCTVSSSGLVFGLYQPLTFGARRVSTDVTSNAVISVSCIGITAGAGFTIALGPTSMGSVADRQMVNARGGDNMRFNVYVDAGYSVVWGDGTTGSMISGSISPGDSSQTRTVYGKVPAGQYTLQAGSYAASPAMILSYSP